MTCFIVNDNSVRMGFNVSEKYQKYFNADWLSFEYNARIDDIPHDILIAPFVVVLAPIIWTLGLTWRIEELDDNLYKSLKKIKTVFWEKYCLNSTGRIICENTTYHKYDYEKSVLFFSGGVDATYSYIQLSDIQPSLIIMKGFDFQYTNDKVWKHLLKNQIIKDEYNIDIVSSPNLRNINFTQINNDFRNINNTMSWWTCYEVGLYTIAHAILPAYKNKYSTIFLSSSFTNRTEPVFGAASQIIDSMSLSWCKFKNYGGSASRIEKLRTIASNRGKIYDLRVCWKSIDGTNCCKCEKCARTIIGLYIIGEVPEKYGFNISSDWYNELKDLINYFTFASLDDWMEMVHIIKTNNHLNSDTNINWLCDMDFHSIHAINYNKKLLSNRKMNW